MLKNIQNNTAIFDSIKILTLSIFGYLASFSDWSLDDAMITLQYSKNIALYGIYSFNLNGNDFATTSIFHTLFSSLFYFFSSSPDIALQNLKFFEILLVIFTLFILTKTFEKRGINPFISIVFLILFLSNNNNYTYLFSGMELPWYLFFVTMIILAYEKKYFLLVGLLGFILFLVRPEAVLVFGIIVLFDFIRSKKYFSWAGIVNFIRKWFAASFLLISLISIDLIVFYCLKGQPLPDTGEVKFLTAQNWGYFYTYLPTLFSQIGVWSIFILPGLYLLLKNYNKLSVFSIFLLFSFVMTVLYSLLLLPKSQWYYLPFHIGVYILIMLGMQMVYQLILDKKTSVLIYFNTICLALIFPTQPDFYHFSTFDLIRINTKQLISREKKRHNINRAAGLWIKNNTQETDTVAVANIGYIGYYADRHIVDIVGLLNPDIARNHRNDVYYWYNTYKPKYIVDKYRGLKKYLKRHPEYEVVKVIGSAKYNNERMVIFKHK
ncbi:hypothetical protein [Candidatus Albibeggiatoa sp. nov. NOAA]|uniref:hypothetical protein n=1 Tax=Candidatus Albibeggiatoa sp. nov. NOAA TaxID=3162724 RepID=UPI0032F718A9|nr:hypothetical protein [Thiotrichaceae bacterium]